LRFFQKREARPVIMTGIRFKFVTVGHRRIARL